MYLLKLKIWIIYFLFIFSWISGCVPSPVPIDLNSLGTDCSLLTKEVQPIPNLIHNPDIELESNLEFTFDPLILPFKLKLDNDGFSVLGKSDMSLVTPIGKFSLEYGISSIRGRKIGGHRITGGDFIVILVNKSKKTKQFFAIKGHNRLKTVIEGKSTVDAGLGYIEIDVTDASIREIEFVDNKGISIVNTTEHELKFEYIESNFDNNEELGSTICSLPPKSYRKTDEQIINFKYYHAQEKAGLLQILRSVALVAEEKDSQGPKGKMKQKILIKNGETCYIKYDQGQNIFYLEKRNI